MIRRLQLKFVAICMTLVTLVLVGVSFSVYSTAQSSVEATSREVLQRVISEDLRTNGSTVTEPPSLGPVQLPYFTVSVWPERDGTYTAYVTGGTYSNLQDTAELSAILTDCLSQNKSEGVVLRYSLRYLRENNGLFTQVAFVDMSAEHATLSRLMRGYLQIAVVCFFVLLGVSIVLSRWATAPVERAWKQQRQFLSDASHELKTAGQTTSIPKPVG